MGPATLSSVSRGRFITIEGGEGTGKSTQARLLLSALERAGIPTRGTREPGGSPNGEAIRRLLLEGDGERWDAVSEALLLVAARRDHVARLIEPSLARGIWVVSDRFADSTIAYQGYGKGLPLAELETLHRFALGGFAADLTLILDLPVEIGLRRAAARGIGADRFERLDPAFHQRLRHAFREIARQGGARCVLIDAAPEPHAVHRAVLDAVEQRLATRLTAIRGTPE